MIFNLITDNFQCWPETYGLFKWRLQQLYWSDLRPWNYLRRVLCFDVLLVSSHSYSNVSIGLSYVLRYMPKDEPSDGLGHRHDWEGVIVWLSNATATTSSNIEAVCPSAHGGWDCSTDSYSLSGTSPLIKYQSIWPLDHSCGLTSTVGGQEPLIAWESLPIVAQTALDDTDFGSANVPFNEDHFETNLAAATF